MSNRLTRPVRLEDGRAERLSTTTEQMLVDKVADYEDAEEGGRLICFPIAPGDYYYCVEAYCSNCRKCDCEFLSCTDCENYKYAIVEHVLDSRNMTPIMMSEFGSEYFASRADAEVKLHDMENMDKSISNMMKNGDVSDPADLSDF